MYNMTEAGSLCCFTHNILATQKCQKYLKGRKWLFDSKPEEKPTPKSASWILFFLLNSVLVLLVYTVTGEGRFLSICVKRWSSLSENSLDGSEISLSQTWRDQPPNGRWHMTETTDTDNSLPYRKYAWQM